MEESSELDKFRLNWVNEINNNNTTKTLPSSQTSSQKTIDDAVALYYQAAQSEEDGDMSGAVVLLRKAYRLDPDLDRHVRELLAEENKRKIELKPNNNNNEELPELTKDFINQFDKINISETMSWNCSGYELLDPESFTQHIHIFDLPDECLTLIMQHLIGRRMDLLSLNQFSETCKYATAKINSNHYLWSLIANRSVSGNNSENDDNTFKNTSKHTSGNMFKIPFLQNKMGSSNHNMPIGKFILKKLSYLRFNGVYVSRITYFRHGEKDINGFYKPFHHIVYYRLVLFYENKKNQLKCVNFTSALDPKIIFDKMMNFVKNGVIEEGMQHGDVVSELCFEDTENSSNSKINNSGCFMKLSADLKPCNYLKNPDKDVSQRITWVIKKKKLIWIGHSHCSINYETPDRSFTQDYFKTSSRNTYPDMTFTPVKILRDAENSVFMNKKL